MFRNPTSLQLFSVTPILIDFKAHTMSIWLEHIFKYFLKDEHIDGVFCDPYNHKICHSLSYKNNLLAPWNFS